VAEAGTTGIGVFRKDLGPEERLRPAPREDEEIVYVLSGAGVTREGDAVGEGHCLVRLAGELAHGLVAGPSGMDVLSFSARAGGLPTDGSGQTIHLRDVDPVTFDKDEYSCVDRDLGRAAGSVHAGLVHLVVEADKLNCPPHCHSAEEELFVVLDGSGTLLLGDEEHPVRAGSVVARPPGTGVAHAFRAGDEPLTLLAYSDRDPNDMCFYPRSGKVSLRGLKAIFRVERLDYWDGEE
jgi:uncharacterized cupin superfamily protein